jgi:cytochrome c oxidase subunit 4
MTDANSEKALLIRVATVLMALLVLTVGVAFINLGPFNYPVAITIAMAKASIVGFFFMELRQSSKLLWLMAAAAIIWLMILIGGTLADVLTRIIPTGLPA